MTWIIYHRILPSLFLIYFSNFGNMLKAWKRIFSVIHDESITWKIFVNFSPARLIFYYYYYYFRLSFNASCKGYNLSPLKLWQALTFPHLIEAQVKINKIWSRTLLEKRFLFEFLKVTIMKLVKFNYQLTKYHAFVFLVTYRNWYSVFRVLVAIFPRDLWLKLF